MHKIEQFILSELCCIYTHTYVCTIPLIFSISEWCRPRYISPTLVKYFTLDTKYPHYRPVLQFVWADQRKYVSIT